MWLSRQTWDQERDARIKAEAETASIKQYNIALQTTMDWQRVRLNQLEHERARLIETYMGVKIAVPEISAEPMDSASILQEVPNFDDVGDEQATKLGIQWNDLGEVVHLPKKA